VKTFIFPGSFDPFSLGHLDIAKRASTLCDHLLVAVMHNSAKKYTFSIEERVFMVKECLKDIPNVEVIPYESLLINLYHERQATAVVRGLRSESDFRNEVEMAAANTLLFADYQVVLLPCRADLAFTSSTIIKEVAYYGGDISRMVSPSIQNYINRKFGNQNEDKD